MRTIDRFAALHGGCSFASRDVLELMGDSPKIRVQNVAEYWWLDPKMPMSPGESLPNIAPPWQSGYCEYRVPKGVFGGARAMPDGEYSVGILFKAFRLDEISSKINGAEATEFLGGWRIYVLMSLFGPDPGVPGVAHIGTESYRINVHADGSPEIQDDGVERKLVYHELPVEGLRKGFGHGGLPMLAAPLLASFCFSHCKAQVSMAHEEVPPKLRAKQAREGRVAVDRWHVLDIAPVKKLLDAHRKAGDSGIKQALHLCRGHFRDYKDGRGLFGKYHGVYWVPPTLKGSRSRGKVNKDYEVAAPAASN